jgi:hypothetical protein
MVGLGSIDNTSDASKPVSTLTQTQLDLKATTVYVDGEVSTINTTTTGNREDIDDNIADIDVLQLQTQNLAASGTTTTLTAGANQTKMTVSSSTTTVENDSLTIKTPSNGYLMMNTSGLQVMGSNYEWHKVLDWFKIDRAPSWNNVTTCFKINSTELLLAHDKVNIDTPILEVDGVTLDTTASAFGSLNSSSLDPQIITTAASGTFLILADALISNPTKTFGLTSGGTISSPSTAFQITCPAAGDYQVSFSSTLGYSASAGNLYIFVYKGSSPTAINSVGTMSATSMAALSGSGIISCSANDVLTLRITGNAANMGAVCNGTSFNIQKLTQHV